MWWLKKLGFLTWFLLHQMGEVGTRRFDKEALMKKTQLRLTTLKCTELLQMNASKKKKEKKEKGKEPKTMELAIELSYHFPGWGQPSRRHGNQI